MDIKLTLSLYIMFKIIKNFCDVVNLESGTSSVETKSKKTHS